MTDPLTWSPINLGRWAGTQVRIHAFLIIFVVLELISAALFHEKANTAPLTVSQTGCWLLLLLLALAVHEFGHAAMASWLGCEPDEVRLWPLGNMVSPAIASRSNESALVAVAGPAANAIVYVATAVGLRVFSNAYLAWIPFTDPQNPYGAPTIGKVVAPFPSGVWFVGVFGFINCVIMLANLIPALPFDGGRMLRAYLANSPFAHTKDNLVGIWTARCFAIILFVAGLVRLVSQRGDGFTLIGLALLIEWMVRSEARMLEDGGFYEDGVFGYDFSEGYTSLEGSAAKVRPYRESVLRRWRRVRSERRRARRLARQAAEEKRMDEILEKLHHEGRSALSDEEHRFLVRVSAKYRNKQKNP
jgi:Zn-dependent protease